MFFYPPYGGGDTLAIWRRQGKAAGFATAMFSSLIQSDARPEQPADDRIDPGAGCF
jgi:hypothetical protein